MKAFKLVLLSACLFALQLQADTAYRIVNSTGRNVTLYLDSPFRVEKIAVPAGGVRTKWTTAANCIDNVKLVLSEDPYTELYIGGAVCAGSIVCVHDNGNGPEAVAFPYYAASPCQGSAKNGKPVYPNTWQTYDTYTPNK